MGFAGLLTLHNSFIDFCTSNDCQQNLHDNVVHLPQHTLFKKPPILELMHKFYAFNGIIFFHFSYPWHFGCWKSNWVGNYYGYKEIALQHWSIRDHSFPTVFHGRSEESKYWTLTPSAARIKFNRIHFIPFVNRPFITVSGGERGGKRFTR